MPAENRLPPASTTWHSRPRNSRALTPFSRTGFATGASRVSISLRRMGPGSSSAIRRGLGHCSDTRRNSRPAGFARLLGRWEFEAATKTAIAQTVTRWNCPCVGACEKGWRWIQGCSARPFPCRLAQRMPRNVRRATAWCRNWSYVQRTMTLPVFTSPAVLVNGTREARSSTTG